MLAEGIGPGSVIAVLHRNHRDVLLTLSAASKIGARAVLMNTGFAGPQLIDVSAREQVAAVVADHEFDELFTELPATTRRLDVAALSRDQPADTLPHLRTRAEWCC